MRFPEFSDEWEKTTLGNISNIKIYQPQTIKPLNFGKYKVFGANGYIGYYKEYNHNTNQVTISCRGEKSGIVNFVESFVWITGNSMVLNLDKTSEIIKKFLYYELIINNVNYLITGSGQPQLTRDNLVQHKIYFPNIDEQTKIADFLSLIDKRIELQNKIIKDYELLKKEINIKMFTHSPKLPTLRFKEFKNDLAIKKIKNIVEYSKSGGGTPNTSIKEYYNGTIPFLSISDITVQSKYIYSTNKHITELGLKNSSTWIVPINTVTLTMYASFGIPCIIKNNMCTSQAMYNMIINKNNNYEYVYYYLNFLKNIRYYNSLAEQGSQFNLNSSIIKNINLFFPSLKEQLKIANFLSKLDEILLNVKCEKERLIKNKTFLLQNLFI